VLENCESAKFNSICVKCTLLGKLTKALEIFSTANYTVTLFVTLHLGNLQARFYVNVSQPKEIRLNNLTEPT